jgi:class 3 adenylate cyclase
MATVLARELVAVMFTDMVGHTALLLSDERDAVEKRSAYWAALESAHAALGGTNGVPGQRFRPAVVSMH